ncbi:YitT family protein [Thermotoga profunda]|uniref:YitT family protein n=1 Tax=Thermotoga profunda TaxID=1508420 RepID=UPI000596D092|nr:YitT family protein [Thermotoga profunda]
MNKSLVIREYILASVGVLITAIGLVVFLIPNNIAAGGASGLAMVLNGVIKLPVGVWMYIINGLLFLIAFLTVGFDFSIKTIYCTFLITFLVDLFDRFIKLPRYIAGDMMLAVFFGDVLTAIGMAITFTQNASTGGTDIVARILNRYYAAPMGTTLLIVDFIIGVLAGLTFGVRTGMYAILAIIINGMTIDFVMKGIETSTQVIVISEKNEQIADFVLNKLKRGATYLDGYGAYTKKYRKILLIVLRRRELGELISFIRKTDKSSFIIVNEARYTFGEGFQNIRNVF